MCAQITYINYQVIDEWNEYWAEHSCYATDAYSNSTDNSWIKLGSHQWQYLH